MKLQENIKIAFVSIKGNALRAVITSLIISIGIMALVGILTAIDGIKSSISENFSSMGANSFNIRNRGSGIHVGKGGRQAKNYRPITFHEAIEFSERYTYPATASISVNASRTATLKRESEKTNPNIMVMGSDDNYLACSGYSLSSGRNFSKHEVLSGAHVAIIGDEVRLKLFKKSNPLGQTISIGNSHYRVIGTLNTKGSSIGFGGDRIAIIPIHSARQRFSRPEMTFVITVMANHTDEMDAAVGEAISTFRSIRKLRVKDENNFDIQKSDSLANTLIDNIKFVTLAATIIGFITLLGAAIGLMNIMLVSVTERTREIGTRKAVGATANNIRQQFLTEAVVICQLGGIGGIVLGIAIGNIVSSLIGGGFIIPWVWMISGVVLCLLVGVISGYYPASKAAKLDPIESLRFE